MFFVDLNGNLSLDAGERPGRLTLVAFSLLKGSMKVA